MSGGLAPSKTTVYVGNIPFSLTNNDLHKVFEKYGKVVKITIMKDKVTRRSKGVAFVLFLKRDSAHDAVRNLNNSQLFGRTISASIAKDNGRAAEFIRRREYKDKSMCYECGDGGHLSYECPKNSLGDRERPPKKERKRRKKDIEDDAEAEDDEEDVGEDPRIESLASVISAEAELRAKEDVAPPAVKRYKQNEYFSDEEELSD